MVEFVHAVVEAVVRKIADDQPLKRAVVVVFRLRFLDRLVRHFDAGAQVVEQIADVIVRPVFVVRTPLAEKNQGAAVVQIITDDLDVGRGVTRLRHLKNRDVVVGQMVEAVVDIHLKPEGLDPRDEARVPAVQGFIAHIGKVGAVDENAPVRRARGQNAQYQNEAHKQ
ncbi:MAG: hypothetical protein M5R36_02210 [Deltaproteobacteria bacterium]|nr:hypothetical protein [Deltaproteobacteria bacterium]